MRDLWIAGATLTLEMLLRNRRTRNVLLGGVLGFGLAYLLQRPKPKTTRLAGKEVSTSYPVERQEHARRYPEEEIIDAMQGADESGGGLDRV